MSKLVNLVLFCLCSLLFVYSEPAIEAAKSALTACAVSVIPSLFPYVVLSNLIVRHRLLAPLYRLIPMRVLFGLPPASAGAFLLGGLCGFPIGAKTVCDLYKTGQLTREEAERTCAISNNTGPAFAVSVAGGIFWGSRNFGIYLYTAQLFAAVFVGVLFRCRRGKSRTDETAPAPAPSPAPNPVALNPVSSFIEAISAGAAACIPLCGYITFFAILCAIVREMLPWKGAAAAVCAVFEFTSGIREAAAINGYAGLFLTGFSLGFSGLSVFMQSYNFTFPHGISLRRTLICKALQGILCGGLCLLYPILLG